MILAEGSRVLVTGGAGFIGHRLVARLLDRGYRVAVVDNLYSGMPMPAAKDGLSLFQADIRDADALARAFDEAAPDAVVHLAAVHHIPTCERERALALDVNIVGAERVLAECERLGVKLVVLASSGAVYAPVAGVLVEDETALEAIDNYSLCKIANESQGRLWVERTGGAVRIARIFNTVGHDDPNGHLIPDILEQLVRETGAIRLGNTSARRDYIHADDTADGLLAVLTQGAVEAPLEAFNIACGREYPVTEIIRIIGDLMAREVRCELDASRLRRVDRPSLVACTAKTKARTGWSAQSDLRETIRRTLAGRGVLA